MTWGANRVDEPVTKSYTREYRYKILIRGKLIFNLPNLLCKLTKKNQYVSFILKHYRLYKNIGHCCGFETHYSIPCYGCLLITVTCIKYLLTCVTNTYDIYLFCSEQVTEPRTLQCPTRPVWWGRPRSVCLPRRWTECSIGTICLSDSRDWQQETVVHLFFDEFPPDKIERIQPIFIMVYHTPIREWTS